MNHRKVNDAIAMHGSVWEEGPAAIFGKLSDWMICFHVLDLSSVATNYKILNLYNFFSTFI